MVFQKPTPFPMSIYENIAFGIRLYEQLSRAELDAAGRMRRCAAPRCGTRSRTSCTPSGLSLSGGQQQRLCIARTVAVKPEVILLDEPCSALDPISTAKIEELIDELKDDYTIAIVTHNMQQAARVSDFTAFMYLGELVEFGDDRQDVHHAHGQAHPGLHHRPLRLMRASGGTKWYMTEHTHQGVSTTISRSSSRIDRRDGRPRRAPDRRRDSTLLKRHDTALLAEHHRRRQHDRRCSQREIEEKAILTIARRQPMAIDLRDIVGALRVSNDLERIGDLAKNIAKRVMRARQAELDLQKVMRGVEHMAELVLHQIKDVLDAYSPPRRRQGAARSGSATRRSTRSTTRCSASCSPT